MNYDIERSGQSRADRPPSPHGVELQSRHADTLEVLMGNCVSPLVQHLEGVATLLGAVIMQINGVPELQPEPTKVCSDAARLSVLTVELPVAQKIDSKNVLHRGRRKGADYVIARLRMQVAAESLEVAREKQRVGMVDLVCCVPSSAPRTADRLMSAFDVVQGAGAYRVPENQRSRRHRPLRILVAARASDLEIDVTGPISCRSRARRNQLKLLTFHAGTKKD